ncbi:MAG: 16S rRNA (cytosine(1402)-N(4))-methyltransferase RsmH [Clostridia bacterium]|nr:16S rRNA (cytosine(1402)-N(4))-methyltransferase RsmH [Clostridia bacterium]
MENGFSHVSVLLREAVDALAVKPDGVYLDCTAGGGGHSEEIARRLTTGRLISLDRDADAVRAAGARLAPYGERCRVIQANFADAGDVLADLGIRELDGATADLGVSSYQLDHAERGFSYMADAPLDMRMDRDHTALTAREIVNTYSEEELADLIFRWGEERFARRIAAAIVREREKEEITGTLRLAEIVKNAVPAAARAGGHHPAKRTFQAIRIEVNSEIRILEPSIRTVVGLLAPGGRISVITFHSLEDRAVKETFADLASGCTCPPDFPVCVCGRRPRIRILNKKPILPSEEETETNPRARSAKLRTAEKL